MSNYLQIAGDPTKWWPTDPFHASQLTGQPLSIPVNAPIQATLVLSGKSASVAVFDSPSGQTDPGPGTLEPQVPYIYVPTASGLSAGHVGYELPTNVNLTDLANQIMASMRSGHSQAVTLGGSDSGGTLVLNGATLSFAVLVTPIVLGIGGSMPHD
jgi:hypothetical protein